MNMTENDQQKEEGPLALGLRQPPANIEAEQALLGALLTNNRAYDRVSDFLAAEHFANRVNGRIFEAIARRIEAGQLADPVTMRAELEHSGVLESVGGMGYLAQWWALSMRAITGAPFMMPGYAAS